MKFLLILNIFNLFILLNAREQDKQPVRNGIVGESIQLPCSPVNSAQYLRWRFIKNGTLSTVDAGQIYPGGLPKVFGNFDVPEGRSEIIVSNSFFLINVLKLEDEGDYWCEISSADSETIFSEKLPVHIWKRPNDPTMTPLRSNLLTEGEEARPARCASEAGRPAATLTWLNGTTPIYAPEVETIIKKNTFNSLLNDSSLDLLIKNPTRFDHNRMFFCKIDHPAYEEPLYLNYTVQVKYHPWNIKMWANGSTNQVFCSAEGFPEPEYAWKLPGNIAAGTKSTTVVYIDKLEEMYGGAFFHCEAYNGLNPNATIRMTVDQLLYPDGKPGLLGLDWWIWGAIAGGIVAFIVIIIIIICCRRRAKKAHGGGTLQTKYTKASNKQPIVITTTHDQGYNQRDREDSFDDDISPSPATNQRRFMGDDTYIKDVTLVPSNDIRGSRDNLYNSNRSNSRENLYSQNRANSRENLHASREQLSEAADHIATLNKSWDYLSRSREELNNVQSELQHTRDSHIHGSQENLDTRDSIPFMDHQDDRYYDDSRYNTGNYNANEYPEKVPLDDRQDYGNDDDRYKTYNAPPRYTENSGYGDQYNQQYDANSQQYDDRSYDRNQDYNQGGQRYYPDGQYNDQQQGYEEQQYDDRDQRQGNNYNYHPARIV